MQLLRHIACSGSTLPRCGKSPRFMHRTAIQMATTKPDPLLAPANSRARVPPIMDRSASSHAAAWVAMRSRVHLVSIDGAPSVADPTSWLANTPAGSSTATRRGCRYSRLQFLLRPSGRAIRALGSNPNDCFRVVTWQESASGAERVNHLRIWAFDAARSSVDDEDCRAAEISRRRRR